MKEHFLTYEQSLAVKELGFDEPCLGYWNIDPYLPKPTFNLVKPFDHEWCVPTPLKSQFFKWVRQKYKLLASVQYFTGGYYCYTINDMQETKVSNRLFTEFETYEQAEDECIKKIIELIKNK